MTDEKPLSDRQKSILSFIRQYVQETYSENTKLGSLRRTRMTDIKKNAATRKFQMLFFAVFDPRFEFYDLENPPEHINMLLGRRVRRVTRAQSWTHKRLIWAKNLDCKRKSPILTSDSIFPRLNTYRWAFTSRNSHMNFFTTFSQGSPL